ncbi:hypothetical protein OKW24_004893 [Peribacillus simplex]|nr:hypothetical protein [Peribacillus simplex]SNT53728.1 hypothetical protein SAMN05444672_14312 [Bacillus sp. OK838]
MLIHKKSYKIQGEGIFLSEGQNKYEGIRKK